MKPTNQRRPPVPLRFRAHTPYHKTVESPGTCPADLQEVAEAYLMHRLSEDQVDAFEEHYFDCEECAMDVRSGNLFARGIWAVGREDALTRPRAVTPASNSMSAALN